MLSSELEFCLNEAFQNAQERRHEFMTVEHLLLALVDERGEAGPGPARRKPRRRPERGA